MLSPGDDYIFIHIINIDNCHFIMYWICNISSIYIIYIYILFVSESCTASAHWIPLESKSKTILSWTPSNRHTVLVYIYICMCLIIYIYVIIHQIMLVAVLLMFAVLWVSDLWDSSRRALKPGNNHILQQQRGRIVPMSLYLSTNQK